MNSYILQWELVSIRLLFQGSKCDRNVLWDRQRVRASTTDHCSGAAVVICHMVRRLSTARNCCMTSVLSRATTSLSVFFSPFLPLSLSQTFPFYWVREPPPSPPTTATFLLKSCPPSLSWSSSFDSLGLKHRVTQHDSPPC